LVARGGVGKAEEVEEVIFRPNTESNVNMAKLPTFNRNVIVMILSLAQIAT